MIGLKLDNDDLSKLFPKCRPATVRSTDLNLNPLCDDDTDHDMDLTQSNERQRNRYLQYKVYIYCKINKINYYY